MSDQHLHHSASGSSPRPMSVSPRHTLSGAAGYAVAAYAIGLGFFASLVPSPLYATYSDLWDFSTPTLTLIYATYALGILVALLVVGSASDDVGRRPVLIASISLLGASTLFFVFATSTWWLFVGRGLQGLATGAAISSASATLVDLQRRRDPVAVAVTNGVATNTGLGLGIFVSSLLVQLVASPLKVPYLVLLALAVLGVVGAVYMPEPVARRRRFQLRVERPGVPPVARTAFLLAAMTVLSSWSIGGVNFSLGPQVGAQLFDSTDPVVANLGIYALLGSAAITQLVLGRTIPWLAASGGAVALATGMICIALGTAADRSSVYLLGSIISGVGFGLSFLGGLRGLVAVIPPPHPAHVVSAFYLVGYASLSIPAVVAGLVVTSLGLQRTFEIFALIAAGLALVVAVGAWLSRPSSQPAAG